MKATSAIGAALLLLFAAYLLTGMDALWHPSRYGTFGIALSGARVTSVEPGSSSAKAGIAVGDRVDRPATLQERIFLDDDYGLVPAGERITITFRHAGTARTAIVRALPLGITPPTVEASMLILDAACILFVAVGFVLVIVRPSRMTWAFYLVSLAYLIIFLTPVIGNTPGVRLALNTAFNIIAQAGICAFLIFCIRFPNDKPLPVRRRLERIATFSIAPAACVTILYNLSKLNVEPRAIVLGNVLLAFDLAIIVVGLLTFGERFVRSSDLDRLRIRWVALGLGCAGVSAAVAGTSYFDLPDLGPDWASNLISAAFVALPATVAYTTLRYRVVDVRFVVSRSLSVVIAMVLIAACALAIDWSISSHVPRSRLAFFAYALALLALGFLLNSLRSWLTYHLDRTLFPQWYRARWKTARIADLVRNSATPGDLYEPLTAGLSEALSLASSALFERTTDGGFLRVAAHGWPRGTARHVLPDEDRTSLRMPDGAAEPIVALPVRKAKLVFAVLLCGAHINGAGLDADEMRILRRLCKDAALAFYMERKAAGDTISLQTAAASFRLS